MLQLAELEQWQFKESIWQASSKIKNKTFFHLTEIQTERLIKVKGEKTYIQNTS